MLLTASRTAGDLASPACWAQHLAQEPVAFMFLSDHHPFLRALLLLRGEGCKQVAFWESASAEVGCVDYTSEENSPRAWLSLVLRKVYCYWTTTTIPLKCHHFNPFMHTLKSSALVESWQTWAYRKMACSPRLSGGCASVPFSEKQRCNWVPFPSAGSATIWGKSLHGSRKQNQKLRQITLSLRIGCFFLLHISAILGSYKKKPEVYNDFCLSMWLWCRCGWRAEEDILLQGPLPQALTEPRVRPAARAS